MTYRKINFGKNLQELRTRKNVSQQELADVLHVTRQSVSAWERGAGKPDIYILHEVSQYFDVSLDKLMYGIVSESAEDIDTEFDYDRGYIATIDEDGLYYIMLADLMDYFSLIECDLKIMCTTVMLLAKKDFIITEVFDNGFAIFIKDDVDAGKFQKALDDILDGIIHHDSIYIEDKLSRIDKIMAQAEYDIIKLSEKEIFGARTDEFSYYWMDSDDNVRGYAFHEEECAMQAKLQGCEKYTIYKREK